MTIESREQFELCKQVCSIDGCNRRHEAKSFCSMHYKRFKNHGKPELVNPNRTKHGMESSPEYKAWSAMIQRCTNPNNQQYKNYGGRGISVCSRWLDFTNFIADIGARPSQRHEIDRINNDGIYEPKNVRWATRKQQCNNLRKNINITYGGTTKTISGWADELNIKYDTLYSRLYRGWSVERAFNHGQ